MKYKILNLAFGMFLLFTSNGATASVSSKSCHQDLVQLFLSRERLYSVDRKRVDIADDIFFVIKCDNVDDSIGMRLADILVRREDYLGYYLKFRLIKKAGDNSSVFLPYLIKSAELGYRRAMFELYEYYQSMNLTELSFPWLIGAAERQNLIALSLVISNKSYKKLLSREKFNAFVTSFFLLVSRDPSVIKIEPSIDATYKNAKSHIASMNISELLKLIEIENDYAKELLLKDEYSYDPPVGWDKYLKSKGCAVEQGR